MGMGAATAELVVKIVTDASGATKDLDATAKKVGGFQSGLSKAAAPAAAALLAVGAAAVSAAKAAAEDEQAQAILANTMQKTTGASDSQIKAMEDYISAMSLATGVADDELRPAMGNLLRATGDAAKSQEAMTIAMDVAAATGKSVEQVSQAMAKGYGGSASSLKKLVPSLDEATVASGDMDAIMKELAETTGGAAAASADTAAGKMAIFQNAMGEAQEEAGSALIPILTTLAEVLVDVAKWIGENTTVFLIIAGVIATVAAAILVLNVAVGVYTAVTTIAASTTLMAWAAALGPILLVIAVVLLVVGAVVLLWKKSETFRTIVLAVWGAVKTAIDAVITTVQNLIGKIAAIRVPGFIAEAFETIRSAVERAWNWIGNLITKITNIHVPGLIAGAFDTIRSAVERAWNWVGNLITKITNISVPGVISNAFDQIRTAVEHAVTWVGNLIQKIGQISVPGTISGAFATVKGAIDGVISAVQNLISWLGRIKVPQINLPGPFMAPAAPASASTAVFAAPSVASPRAATASSSAPGPTFIINGAIDPEATARQIQRILRGHDRRVGLS
jgi:hypothetical protein